MPELEDPRQEVSKDEGSRIPPEREAHPDEGLVVDDAIPSEGYQKIPLVGLGGSAGSIQALQRLFATLSPTTGFALVVVLHLSPEHESSLPELLGRWTSMRVVAATDGVRLERDTVYVIPPGKHLSTIDGHLRLTKLEPRRGKRVAVDLFFRALADTHGPHAAAVVLSGADADGAIGIKRVKERGGLTIAQDPDEAEQPNMPKSAIATGMVDWVLPVADIPGRLVRYFEMEGRIRLPPEEGPHPATAPATSADLREAALREVLKFLQMRLGRDFSYYKRGTVVRRIARRMQVTGVDDLSAYLSFLRGHSGEAGALLQDLLISVTNFFRDPPAFEALEKHLAKLFEGKEAGDPIRVWVPGCATGEEAYSLAILLLEHADKYGVLPAIQVFACDLDENAIRTARQGLYPETIVADLSEERLRRFFAKEIMGYRLRREVRDLVLFATHDLIKDVPFSRMDLVSCRNLLIYLNREAQARVIEVCHFALRKHGLLFLGSSESIDETNEFFAPLDKKRRIYVHESTKRIELGLVMPAAQSVPVAPSEHPPFVAGRVFLPSNAGRPWSTSGSPGPQQRMDLAEKHLKVLERFAPPSVIVNQEFDIVHVSENAARFLNFIAGAPTPHLFRVVHPMLRLELRAALLRAAETKQAARAYAVPMDVDKQSFDVDIRVAPTTDFVPDCFLVSFDATERDTTQPRELAKGLPETASQVLEHEVDHLREELRHTAEHSEASEEELKAGNEELQAMNEELRSATEELEAGREELQSLNEELTTVNHELKAKVDELSHANTDLHNLMASTAIPTVFLDRDLRIMRYTPSAVALFNFIPPDVGRPSTDIKSQLDYPDLHADATRVLRELQPIEREVDGGNGRSYLARLLPYRAPEERIGGVVLTFVDITDLRAALAQTQRAREEAESANRAKDQFLAMLSHELRTPLTPSLMVAESILEEPNLPPTISEGVEVIRTNIEVESRLIEDLLDLTRIGRGRFQIDLSALDLYDAIRAAFEITKVEIAEKRQQLSLELNAAKTQMTGDSRRLQQVFWNLFKNASKFTPESAVIRVESRNEPGVIVVAVSDTGRGIRPETLPHVFEPFRQEDETVARRYGGLGLGLAIAKATVEAHGGTIEASSAGPGTGATFTVRLPILESPLQ